MTKQRYLPEGMRIATAENREALSSRASMEHAMQNNQTLEAVALLCDSNMCLHFDLGGIQAIMPREEVVWCLEHEQVKDIAIMTRVGKPTCFKIVSITERNDTTIAMLSRRLAQTECISHMISTLTPGDILSARVTHMEGFGAFVDIGCGISSLLSIDSISVSRISHPSDRLHVGAQIYTVVKLIDYSNYRIFVSMRELLGTWEENAAQFQAGQTVAGIIRSIEPYGVFVELSPNLAGLAEIREGTHDRQIAIVGQYAAVYIKSIIPDRMKIKLVLIDSYNGIPPQTKLKYYIDPDKTDRLEHWRYSPLCCRRVIETVYS